MPDRQDKMHLTIFYYFFLFFIFDKNQENLLKKIDQYKGTSRPNNDETIKVKGTIPLSN